MKKRIVMTLLILLSLGLSFSLLVGQTPEKGTLVFNVKNFKSDVKLKRKILKRLKHGGVEWGMVNNNLIVTMVNRKYIKPTLQYTTRYEEKTTLKLDSGEYHLTCIGYILGSNSSDVDKVLSESAYFNLDILKFRIQPGKITTLEVYPTFQKQTHRSFLKKVIVYIPDLRVKINENGEFGEEATITNRLPSSIPWDDYHGYLKY